MPLTRLLNTGLVLVWKLGFGIIRFGKVLPVVLGTFVSGTVGVQPWHISVHTPKSGQAKVA